MIYLEYEFYKSQYLASQRVLNSILIEQEELFTKTQPDAIRYDKDRVQTSPSNNQFDNYLVQKEKLKIDERLAEAKSIIEDRERLMKMKELELRQSMDIKDTIYLYKFVEGLNVRKIANKLNYSASQVYRIIEKIEASL